MGLARIASSGKWQVAPHLALLNRKLLDVAAGRTRRLMVFMPPRSGKSELISTYFPAWYLSTHPEHRVILASYGSDFAAEFGRKARDIVMEHGGLYGVEVRDNSKAADHWNIARHTGGMDTAGVGASLTGRGANLLLIDDPIKNWEEAQSSTTRDAIYNWFTSTAYTRLTPNGAVVLVMTRWHHDDLAGRLLKQMEQGGDQWDVVSLPAICEDGDDPLQRPIGGALWPDRWPLERLYEIKATVGAHIWNSLYQQRPTPDRGERFRLEWFAKRYDNLTDLRGSLKRVVMSVDSAFKTGAGSDYSAIATWATDGVHYYLLNMVRERLEFPDLKRAIIEQYTTYRPDTVLIEDAASGQSIIQELQRGTSMPVVAIKPKGSKQARADLVLPLFEAGKVLLPANVPWLEDFIAEHLFFPKGAHDDMVDTTSMALNRLKTSEVTIGPNIWEHNGVAPSAEAYGVSGALADAILNTPFDFWE